MLGLEPDPAASSMFLIECPEIAPICPTRAAPPTLSHAGHCPHSTTTPLHIPTILCTPLHPQLSLSPPFQFPHYLVTSLWRKNLPWGLPLHVCISAFCFLQQAELTLGNHAVTQKGSRHVALYKC